MAIQTKSGSKTSPREVIERAKAEGVEVVDVRFIDLPGTWQHFSLPLGELEEDSFVTGLGFDGSSIRGFQAIDESDMMLVPDPDSATIDPCLTHKTLFLICDIVDPISREPYSRDARFIAKKAEEHLKKSGVADISYWGPEAEFYIFNSLRFDQNAHSGYYHIDSEEGIWNSGKNSEPNLAFRPRHKEGYFPVPPTDKFQDLRSEIMLKLIEAGVRVEVQHHEVGTAGQAEIDMRFDSLTSMGDKMMVFKYIIKNVAAQHGFVATFMPKPLFQDNGSGMHVHQSLWKDGSNLFADKAGYAGLSEMAVHYIGGLLKHAPALLAICAPTTNSYRPFSACLMAGLDGIKHKIVPPEPVDKDIYELEGEEKAKIKSVPGSLGESLDALEKDHAFLIEGGVITKDVVETWIEYKRKKEVDQVALRPHPWEFMLYHDV